MLVKIRAILMKKGIDAEKARELAAEFVTYWKGAEEGIIEDWRFKGAEGGILAEIAKIIAVAETAKKKVAEKPQKK